MKKEEINIKTRNEISKMEEGGAKLAKVKDGLKKAIKEGVSAIEIEKLTNELIESVGGRASFKMVPKYRWATCVNVNAGVVHGIPKRTIVFKKGDVVSVDVGIYYKKFHTDTSFSVGVGTDDKTQKFLDTGRRTLDTAIDMARAGNRIYDISKAMQDGVEGVGLNVVRALVGHGIGRKLHEAPQIPCFVEGKRSDSLIIPEGATFAIEIMYTQGKPDIKLGTDGWTIDMRDGKISALFEETVVVTKAGPKVLTKAN